MEAVVSYTTCADAAHSLGAPRQSCIIRADCGWGRERTEDLTGVLYPVLRPRAGTRSTLTTQVYVRVDLTGYGAALREGAVVADTELRVEMETTEGHH